MLNPPAPVTAAVQGVNALPVKVWLEQVITVVVVALLKVNVTVVVVAS